LTTHAEAYNFCLDKLALRDHSSRELRQKLSERGCPEELQDQVLQKLRTTISWMISGAPDTYWMPGVGKRSMDGSTCG
jgi:hypothetical protein